MIGRSFVVAIDGPAASGKGTLARRLAQKLNLAHLDTGKIYRAVALKVIEAGASADDTVVATKAAKQLIPKDLDNPALVTDAVASMASKVAALPEVRRQLIDFQRNFSKTPPKGYCGAILDGRDIGTVICPEAHVKLYVTATAEVRAARRHKELLGRGLPSIYAQVLEDIKARDHRDAHRAAAPLAVASDAFLLDTTELDADAAFAVALAYIMAQPGLSSDLSEDISPKAEPSRD
ncbi:MAG: (d)CMP kinase [Alphaproteobacteria bacterium]